MDIRLVFKEINEQLLAEFRKTSGVVHPGGKGTLREDAFATFLGKYLPSKYEVGRGEVITSNNQTSPQLDIVVYDSSHCPALITSTSHGVFPVESVYAALSIKSSLDSKELKDGYENIAEFKRIVPLQSFVKSESPGMQVGLGAPIPVTGVIAYASGRSLEAISEQAAELDGAMADVNLRPDFIAVLDKGIVGPKRKLRGEFNRYALPTDEIDRISIREMGKYTLLRLYLSILNEINAIELRDLQLEPYLQLPELIGGHRVRNHNRFVERNVPEPKHVKLNEKAITEILEYCRSRTPVTYDQHLLHFLGTIPKGMPPQDMKHLIHEYNPKGLPPILAVGFKKEPNGTTDLAGPAFHPAHIVIDEQDYAIDLSMFTDEDFAEDPDHELNDFFA